MSALSAALRARLEWAVLFAERGWYLLPVRPGTRRAAIERWEQRASTDPARVAAFWAAHPEHNVAVACGPSGLLVVDLDMPKPGQIPGREGQGMKEACTGETVLRELARRAGAHIPATYTVATPSGGTHLYFRAPTNPPLGCTRGSFGPLIDTRGHGGYVVAPGLTTPEGAYTLIDDRDPVELPGWITHGLTARPAPDRSAGREIAAERLDSYVAAAVAGQVERVRTAAPGAHNHTLFVCACRVGELVAGGGLTYAAASFMLQQAATHLVNGDCRCTHREITATIASGLRNGARRPRRLPSRRNGAGG